MNEFELIDVFFKSKALIRDELVYGIGDDAACVRVPPGQDLYISTDTLVADVHFSSNWDPYDIAWKAVMVNLSDMAAMAAEPCWLSLALTLPHNDTAWLQRFSLGLHAALTAYHVSLIGGDTTKGPLSMTLTVHGLTATGKGVRRSGAKNQDEIWVSGELGAAALALYSKETWPAADRALLMTQLQRPKPRLDLKAVLQTYATAAIDISDGLAADLHHICKASGFGARLFLESIPIHPLVRQYLPEQALEFSMQGGDDYELCFTSPAAVHDELQEALGQTGLRCYPIGVIETKPGICAVNSTGDLVPLVPKGYRHF